MDVLAKLEILTDAAKYDAACTSSGVRRGFRQGYIGNTTSAIAGCCHTFSADGRCVTLLKVLMSNCCVYDCAYCVNRRSNDTRRAAFTPQELADLTINFYRRNYIEGLFLSSGVLRNPDYTMEQMIRAIRILREEYRFNGYIHAKAIPGAAPELGEQLGRSSCAMLAVTDFGFAAALAEKLAARDEERYGPAAQQLRAKADRALMRQREKRQHEKNMRQGKHKPWAAPPSRPSKREEAPPTTSRRERGKGGSGRRPGRPETGTGRAPRTFPGKPGPGGRKLTAKPRSGGRNPAGKP